MTIPETITLRRTTRLDNYGQYLSPTYIDSSVNIDGNCYSYISSTHVSTQYFENGVYEKHYDVVLKYTSPQVLHELFM